MNNEIARKQPATVVDTRTHLTMTSGYLQRAQLVQKVRREVMTGRVRPIDARPIWNEHVGQWEQRVIQLKPPPPAWRKPLLIALGAASVLGILFALAWWVLASLAALPLGALCVAAVVVLAMMMRAGRSGGVSVVTSTSVNVTTSVRVR